MSTRAQPPAFRRPLALRVAVLLAVALPLPAQAFDVTLESLLHEMQSLTWLVERPSPAFSAAQASSYDRASTSPEAPGWFGNQDHGQFVRVEVNEGRTEHVLLDTPGPGALTRIWSANPGSSHRLRVYIDGGSAPALDARMRDLLWGRIVPPFRAPLSHRSADGWNLYFPIPYATHVKVTVEPINPAAYPGLFYHVGYRTYAPGTEVESFTLARAIELDPLVVQIAATLTEPASVYLPSADSRVVQAVLRTEDPPQIVAAPQPPGADAIVREFRLVPSRTDEEALRHTLIVLSFDGSHSIRAPLGDFFGTGPGLNPYQSLPASVHADGRLVSRWPMPFRTALTIAIESALDDPPTVDCTVTVEPYTWTASSQYFQAGWRKDHAVYAHNAQDWNQLAVQGGGVLVGAALNVANPFLMWWGEGDEKIWVDGDEFPSFFGTGTEDFFGYAWTQPFVFQHAYHALSRAEGLTGQNYGRTSANRWFILDAVPFTTGLRFDLEQWFQSSTELRPLFDAMSYWYAHPEATHNLPPLGTSDIAIPPVAPLVPKQVPGIVVEGETMSLLAAAGPQHTQIMQIFEVAGRQWSDHRQRWWGADAPGSELALGFTPPVTGSRCVAGYFTRSPLGGRFRVRLNGSVGTVVDLHSPPPVVPTEAILLGAFDLPAGQNTVSIERLESEGAESCQDCNELGLDCLSILDIAAPIEVRLYLDRSVVSWEGGAFSIDLVGGELNALRTTNGDFSLATTACLATDSTQPRLPSGPDPAPGSGRWLLARGAHCAVGSYDSSGAGQQAPRDPGVAASAACP